MKLPKDGADGLPKRWISLKVRFHLRSSFATLWQFSQKTIINGGAIRSVGLLFASLIHFICNFSFCLGTMIYTCLSV